MVGGGGGCIKYASVHGVSPSGQGIISCIGLSNTADRRVDFRARCIRGDCGSSTHRLCRGGWSSSLPLPHERNVYNFSIPRGRYGAEYGTASVHEVYGWWILSSTGHYQEPPGEENSRGIIASVSPHQGIFYHLNEGHSGRGWQINCKDPCARYIPCSSGIWNRPKQGMGVLGNPWHCSIIAFKTKALYPRRDFGTCG